MALGRPFHFPNPTGRPAVAVPLKEISLMPNLSPKTPNQGVIMDSSSAIETTPSTENDTLSGLDVDTAAIAEQATEFPKLEKLTPLLQEHKSGIAVVAALWLAIYVRVWLAYLLPFPDLRQTLSVAALALFLLLPLIPTHSSGNLINGLPRYFYTTLNTSLTRLYHRTLPPWLVTHVIPALLLLPLTRAVSLLLLLTVLGVARSYRTGTASVTAATDAAVRRAEAAAQRAAEHARAAMALEMAALQLALSVGEADCSKQRRLDAAKDVREKAGEVAQEVAGVVRRRLDKVRQATEGAKNAVREDGDLELALEAVANLERLLEGLVQAEEAIGRRVQAARENLWRASLGE
ncbi:hypothetical protein RB597_002302 [Gaeumannomyces tritici]